MKVATKKLVNRTAIYAIFGILVVTYAILCVFGLGFPCLFLTFTGVSCLSCGATRAFFAIIQLDFAAALQYNALFTVVVYPSLLFLFVQDYLYALLGAVRSVVYRSLIDRLFVPRGNVKNMTCD